jgi:hypothetical protein
MGKITKRFLAVLFLLFLVFGYPVLQAAADDLNWPTKSITMLVPWSAGGGSDLCVRTLMPFVEKELGVRITVVNQTGANGWIAWTELAKSKPDGYTMSQLNIPAFYSGYLDPQQKRKENLDSFLPIANQISDWGTMVIKKGDPRFSSAKELIEYAKENELLAGDAGTGMEEKYPEPLRRITVENPETGENIVLLTNHLRFAASTIGEIYRDRWEIELFFKTLKQNLKVKTFVGESENALRIQIWTALISLLVIKWLHHLSKAGWSFSNMATMLRLNLFTYRVLRAWLDEPYETPPIA